MNKIRFFSVIMTLVVAFSLWVPIPVMAQAPTAGQSTLVHVKFNNRTGGMMTLSFTGPAGSYFFNLPQGKSDFYIEPGIYTYTMTSQACPGAVNTYKKLFRRSASLHQFHCFRGG